MSSVDKIPQKLLDKNKQQILVLKYMLQDLESCIDDHINYSKLDGNNSNYNKMYLKPIPHIQDIVRNCEYMRKILLEIKQLYR